MPVTLAAPPAVVLPAAPPYCTDQISIRFLRNADPSPEAEDTARVLALHNVSGAACQIDARPRLAFRGKDGRPLPIEPITGFGGHGVSLGHGPAMPRIVIPAGRTATTTLSWVARGPVCHDVETMTVDDPTPRAEGRPVDLGLMMRVRMCGSFKDYVDFRQPFLALEP